MDRFQLTLCLIIFSTSSVAAAPPTLDALFPAGGQAGTTVAVVAEGKFERWPVRAWSGSKSITVQPAKATGKLTIAIASDAEPGTHWLRLFDDEGASIARPFLVGTLPDRLEREPNDEPLKPQVLDSSTVVVNARLEKAGDVDVFSVPLKKGQTLVAALEAFKTLRSPMDATLQILSADGFVLEQNLDYRELDPQIVFTAPKDGNYLARVFAFPAVAVTVARFAGGPNFVYRLTLTTQGFVEHPYPLAVPRDKPGAVELIGWNIPAELRQFPIPIDSEMGIASLSHPQLASPFAVRVEPHAVTMKTKATRAQPQAITLPTTICGRLERAGDIDVYQFDGKKGQKLSFRIEARTLGFLLDPILEVTDGTTTMLKPARATVLNTDPVFDFTVPRDGRYNLEVHDLHRQAGPRHVYRLWAGTPQADFDLKVAADRFTMNAGKPLDIPIIVERKAGFKKEIEVNVEGLPAGVTAATTANAKGLSLRLTAAKAEAFSSLIRIVGRAKDDDKMIRHARANVVETGAAITDLWLTSIR